MSPTIHSVFILGISGKLLTLIEKNKYTLLINFFYSNKMLPFNIEHIYSFKGQAQKQKLKYYSDDPVLYNIGYFPNRW
jgi:hypothetical protein